MPRTRRERETVLALMAGPCPIQAHELARLRRLAGRGLLLLAPAETRRPRWAKLSKQGRSAAARLAQVAAP